MLRIASHGHKYFSTVVPPLKASLPGGNAADSTVAAFERALASGDALEMSGVETYPTGGGISRTKPLVLAVSTREKRERGKRELRESREGGRGSENRRREVCRQASLGLESLSFFLRFFSSASLSRDDSPPLSALTSFLFLPSLLAPLSILTSKKQKTRTKKGHGRDGRARRRERPGAHRGRRGREGLQVHFYAALWTSVKWWGQHVLISRCPSHAALS